MKKLIVPLLAISLTVQADSTIGTFIGNGVGISMDYGSANTRIELTVSDESGVAVKHGVPTVSGKVWFGAGRREQSQSFLFMEYSHKIGFFVRGLAFRGNEIQPVPDEAIRLAYPKAAAQNNGSELHLGYRWDF